MTHGSDRRQRTDHLTIRLTAEERDTIDRGAERADLTPSSYARQTLLGAPQPRAVRRRALDRVVLSRLLGELGKVGSNLNQLAKSHNSGVVLYEAEVLAALEELEPVRDALLAELGRSP